MHGLSLPGAERGAIITEPSRPMANFLLQSSHPMENTIPRARLLLTSLKRAARTRDENYEPIPDKPIHCQPATEYEAGSTHAEPK